MWKQFLIDEPDIALVACDMDGTLLDEHSKLVPEFWPLLQQLTDLGILFVPASGRGYGALADMFPPAELGFIAENGNLVMLKGEEVFSAALDASAVRQALGILRGVGGRNFGAVYCGKSQAYTERTDHAFLAEAGKYYTSLVSVPDLADIRDDCLKIAIFDFESSVPIFEALSPLEKDNQVVLSGPNWVDVMRAGVDKGTGLNVLQEVLGVTPEQTVVFGDFHNDLPMFDHAAHAFAVENGHPDVREAADWVIPPNTQGGVLQVLSAVVAGSAGRER